MKTELSAIANQYAQAVLELAASGGETAEQAVLSDLEGINKVVASDPDFEILLKHPVVPGVEKRRILLELFKGKVQDLTLRLLELLTDRRRLDALPNVESEYRRLLFAKENIVTATLTSAKQLSQSDTEMFQSKLTQKLGKKLRLDMQVDSSLIGGLILKIGDEVIDGSLSGKLRALEKQLLSV